MAGASFDEDLFERGRLADNLIIRLHGLASGQVVTIDAPWGDGKTFFASNFKRRLDEKKLNSVLIDAFEYDYMTTLLSC